jgi:hypothetical protein
MEKKFYKKEFDEHLDLAKSLEEATKQHARRANSDLTAETTTKKAQSLPRQKPESTVAERLKQLLDSVVTFLYGVKSSIQGENSALTLEESGALECFEDALRLTDPPEQMFAGDTIFQLLIGSLLLTLPNSWVGLLSASVAPSIYK